MSRFHVRYVQAATWLLPLVASTLVGLHLSRWLAGIPLRSSPKIDGGPGLSVHIPKTPDPAVTATWVGLFRTARREIWLAAGRLESEEILHALDEASKRGVAVHLTLSPAQNPSPDAGARAWLRDKTSLRDVRVSTDGFEGAACVVDGTYAVITGQGLLASIASAKDGGIFFYAANSDIGASLTARLCAQHAAAEADPPP